MCQQILVISNAPQSMWWDGSPLHCEQKPGGAEATALLQFRDFPSNCNEKPQPVPSDWKKEQNEYCTRQSLASITFSSISLVLVLLYSKRTQRPSSGTFLCFPNTVAHAKNCDKWSPQNDLSFPRWMGNKLICNGENCPFQVPKLATRLGNTRGAAINERRGIK